MNAVQTTDRAECHTVEEVQAQHVALVRRQRFERGRECALKRLAIAELEIIDLRIRTGRCRELRVLERDRDRAAARRACELLDQR
jgi:hypothetical protein